MARLDELVVENFRGAASPLHLSFVPGKKITVVFGENGTGKTTIVDAIDLIANGNIGSISQKSSTNVNAHSPTLGKSVADIRVSAATGEKRWTGSVKSSKVFVEPGLGPRAHILRRSNLQRFIDAKPAERYSELRYLIAVDQVEKSERALGDAMNYAANTANTFARDRANAHSMLQSIWVSEGSPGNDPISWAESQVQQNPSAVGERESCIHKAIRGLRALQDAVRVHEENVRQLAFVSAELSAVRQQLDMTPGVGIEQSILLSRVLREVQVFLEGSDSAQQCPVCEQPVIANDLQETVSVRLREMQEYRDLDDRRVAWQRKQILAQENVRSGQDRLIASKQALISIADSGNFQLDVEDRTLLEADDTSRIVELVERLLDRAESQRDELQRTTGRLNALREALKGITEAEQETSEYVQKQAALKAALNIVRTERHLYSKRLLDEVAEETNRLYERIHPDEGLAISKLELDPKQRASLHQGVTFGGSRHVPPQAYFSEAHLDTLGFCFWLAVAKRDAAEDPPIVIIDDVFSSIDSDHTERIVDLLLEESEHFDQVIVTTHHRNLRSQILGVRGTSSKVQSVELSSFWSLDRGIICESHTPSVSELRAIISSIPFKRQDAASKAGVQLEKVLDALALQYQLPLPRNRRNEYTLSPLLDAVGKKLCKQLVITSDEDPAPRSVSDIFDQIRQNEYVRNQVGAHHNYDGGDVPDRTVLRFAELTCELVETVTCPHCGQIPVKVDGPAFRCTCPAERRTYMKPLSV